MIGDGDLINIAKINGGGGNLRSGSCASQISGTLVQKVLKQ